MPLRYLFRVKYYTLCKFSILVIWNNLFYFVPRRILKSKLRVQNDKQFVSVNKMLCKLHHHDKVTLFNPGIYRVA